MSLHMESWTTVVNDLVQSLTTPADQATAKLPCLLELLSVLPEEAENYKVGRATATPALWPLRSAAPAACVAAAYRPPLVRPGGRATDTSGRLPPDAARRRAAGARTADSGVRPVPRAPRVDGADAQVRDELDAPRAAPVRRARALVDPRLQLPGEPASTLDRRALPRRSPVPHSSDGFVRRRSPRQPFSTRRPTFSSRPFISPRTTSSTS